ncbi:MAG: FecR/PupR family sigma factor regulator, partial [Alphaproteobacteria bacterium]
MAIDPVSHEAASWFALFAGRAGTAADRVALGRWLDADPRHREAYDRIARLWDGASMLPGLAAVDER